MLGHMFTKHVSPSVDLAAASIDEVQLSPAGLHGWGD